eukprot:m.44706 g.44706  ORF g.44706 m.44706 type:complete len:53 (+) comp15099_c0_seq2:198-356(+)
MHLSAGASMPFGMSITWTCILIGSGLQKMILQWNRCRSLPTTYSNKGISSET